MRAVHIITIHKSISMRAASQNHCYTLYTEPPRPAWIQDAAAPAWAAAWASGTLDPHPLLRLLAGRLAGGLPILEAVAATASASAERVAGGGGGASRCVEVVLASSMVEY